MANSYFRFREFTVDHDRCAMKVCTDSCLFGAWIPVNDNIRNILDIGAGTGLLSLMLAQRSMAQIDAVEIDSNAAEQAGENFQRSPWRDRLYIHGIAVQQFSGTGYDLIVTNPPFYSDALKGPNNERNVAMHSNELSFDELLQSVSAKLNKHGRLAVLLPPVQSGVLENLAAKHLLYPCMKAWVRQTPGHDVFRVMSLYSFDRNEKCTFSELTIKNEKAVYTDEFRNLLKDYYYADI